jgi:hypothetical protein
VCLNPSGCHIPSACCHKHCITGKGRPSQETSTARMAWHSVLSLAHAYKFQGHLVHVFIIPLADGVDAQPGLHTCRYSAQRSVASIISRTATKCGVLPPQTVWVDYCVYFC